jgi:hypothetical protein
MIGLKAGRPVRMRMLVAICMAYSHSSGALGRQEFNVAVALKEGRRDLE